MVLRKAPIAAIAVSVALLSACSTPSLGRMMPYLGEVESCDDIAWEMELTNRFCEHARQNSDYDKGSFDVASALILGVRTRKLTRCRNSTMRGSRPSSAGTAWRWRSTNRRAASTSPLGAAPNRAATTDSSVGWMPTPSLASPSPTRKSASTASSTARTTEARPWTAQTDARQHSCSWKRAMTVLFTSSGCLEHETAPGHPERPARLASLLRHLEDTGLLADLAVREAPEAARERPAAHAQPRLSRCAGALVAGGRIGGVGPRHRAGARFAARRATRRRRSGGRRAAVCWMATIGACSALCVRRDTTPRKRPRWGSAC